MRRGETPSGVSTPPQKGTSSQWVKDINRAILRAKARGQDVKEEKKPEATVVVPYVKGTTDRIGRMLRKLNVRTVFGTHWKVSNMLRSPKDPLPVLHTSGVYRIPCSCGLSYVGQTGRSIEVRLKEHQADLAHGRIERT
jgi:hypothetical protein